MKDPRFSFRRAGPADKGAVLALTAKIWEGEDYIPACFDEWVADREGEFALCFFGDRLVGLGKLSWLASGEAWLEGLRKDPEAGMKGVGQAICGHFLERLAKEAGLRSLRFSTYYENAASISLNTALGFREIARATCLHLVWPVDRPRPSPDSRLETLRRTDAAEAFAFIRASGWFGPLIHEAWRSYSYSEELFVRRYLDSGSCLALRDGRGRLRGLAAALVNREKGTGALPFFDAEDEVTARILLDGVETALRGAGAGEVECFLPSTELRAKAFLGAAGYAPWEREEDYLIFEMPLDALAVAAGERG